MRQVVLSTTCALLVGAIAAACGDGGGAPLGGPYGGTSSYTKPNSGNENSGGASGTSGSSSSGGSAGATGSGGSGGASGTGAGGASGTGASGSGGASGTGASGSGGTSGSGAADSGPPPPVDSGPPPTTWTDCWTMYLAPGAGSTSCVGSCHRHDFEGATTAKGTYSWLKGRGYIDGTTSPPLISGSQSCFTWLGGNMPPSGPYSSSGANTCFDAWAAAGALDN